MTQDSIDPGREFYAATYDVSVPGWPGEIDFYRSMAEAVKRSKGSILEIGCGTGRVAIRLAEGGVDVVGLDLSEAMLRVARGKSVGIRSMSWVLGDMRSFDLGGQFDLVIIPGHAFQNLTSANEQVSTLESIRRHLRDQGCLVVHLDHLDFAWLGSLVGERGGRYEPAEQFRHPQTGREIRASRAWSYEPSSQTAVCETKWEETEPGGKIGERWHRGPVRLHCVFRFEMEHLLARTGFQVEALYGDFYRKPLDDGSTEMIWVARARRDGGGS
jgi:SAM-dependent methyltransferase